MDGRYRHGHRPAGSGGIWGSHLITTWVAAQAKKKAAENAEGATALGVIGMPLRLALWSVVVLVALAADLLQSRVRNYKQMYVRRIVFGLGVTYQTSPDTIEAIPPIVREIIEAQPNARFDRGHFKAFGDFLLDFEFAYPTQTVFVERAAATGPSESMSADAAQPAPGREMSRARRSGPADDDAPDFDGGDGG